MEELQHPPLPPSTVDRTSKAFKPSFTKAAASQQGSGLCSPGGPSQSYPVWQEGEGTCQRLGLDEVTVLLVSMEAINTHKVMLQHLSLWQPSLSGTIASEGGAQGGGCECTHVCVLYTCIYVCVHMCPGV